MTDWSPLIQAGGLVITSVLVPWLTIEYRRRTGIELTNQQREAVYRAIDTAKGLIETQIDQGKIGIADITTEHPEIRRQATEALRRVMDSAVSQGTTVDAAAAMIVARVDTTPRAPPP